MKFKYAKKYYVYRLFTLLLLIFTTSSWAQFDFEMTTSSTTIEDNANFDFYFEHTSGADNLAIMQILIGENRDDTNALLINIRRGTEFIEVGESGQRGRYISGGRAGSETIINGTRVQVNLALSRLTTIGVNQSHLRINLSFRNKEFEGIKRIFMDARDTQGEWGGQRQVATITVVQPDRSTSRHKPEIISLDPYNSNEEDGSRVSYNLNVKDKDGKDDLRNVIFEMSYIKSRGIFGSSRYSVNFIFITVNFENNTYSVYDKERGYYRVETRTVGAPGQVELNGATVDVISIKPELFEPEEAYAVKLQLTFTNRWAGHYEMSANASDLSYKYSGKKGLGSLDVEGGTQAPYPTSIAPNDLKMNYREAPGDRIPVRFSAWFRDDDGADDIKIADIKIARDSGHNDDIFFMRFYPNDNKTYVADSQIDFDNSESSTAGGDRWNDNGYFHGSELSMLAANAQTMRIDFPLELKEAFSGEWKIFMRSMDYAENKTDWQEMGSLVVAYSGSKPRPTRSSLDFDLGIISSQYEFRDNDGPNDIEEVEFVVTPTRPQDESRQLARMIYNNREDNFTIFGTGSSLTEGNPGDSRGAVRTQGNIRVYFPQTRMVGLVGSKMYFFLCAQLTRDVEDGLYLVYARTKDTRGNTSRWVLLSTYKHDDATPYFRP